MSEIGNSISNSENSNPEKVAAPLTTGAGDGQKIAENDQNKTPPSSPRKYSAPRPNNQYNNQQQQTSPRKFSHQPQQKSTSPPGRKFSQRQQQQQQSSNQFQSYQQQNQQQFQPSWRKSGFQQHPNRFERQHSMPTFRPAQYPDGPWAQLQHNPPASSNLGQRRGFSHSVSFQDDHQIPQRRHQYQDAARKTSYQHQMRSANSIGSADQSQDPMRRRHSTGGKNRKKSDLNTGNPPTTNSSRPAAKLSYAGPRWSSLSESMENGSGEYDYYADDFEMEEPFSESDEDETPEEREARHKRQAKPLLLLPMPRRRIRTLSGMIPAVGYAPVWGGPTMCLNCLEFFDLPKQTQEYVQHLLDKHKIVVTDIELIVDLKRYIEHWRHRFGQEPIEKIFPLITPAESDALFGKVENYYLMSERVPEDRQIRERLALRRLEEVLSCQQRERDDRTFNRQCLFCRYRTKGNRAKLVHHLYTIHHLNLGSPDNLVFVTEYLDVLEGKLKRNECIYCEKTFPDHPTLSEHMRKKQHREVNPKNNYYDRFYVINYLELGKRWLEVLAEDFEDNTPTFVDSEEEEEEESWNEWCEDAEDDNEMTAVCLFCDDSFEEATKLLDHMKETHNYDLKKTFADGQLGFYERVKFINYIRKLTHGFVCFVCGTEELRSWQALRKHLAHADHLTTPLEREKWDKDEYLIPTYDNDNVLCMLEDILEMKDEDFGPFVECEKNSADVGSLLGRHDTILEDNEDVEKEDEEQPTMKTDDQKENETKESNDEQQGGEKRESESATTHGIVVIPEELPELEDSALNDPELREQLK